jgi:hypothetical protein
MKTELRQWALPAPKNVSKSNFKNVHFYRQKIVALLEFEFDLRLQNPIEIALGYDMVTTI